MLIVFCKIDRLTLLNIKLINTLIKINHSLSTFRKCQDSRERGKGDWHWLFTKKHFDIDCLYHRQGNEQKQVAIYSSTPNLKSPSIRTPSLLKKNLFQFQNIYILSNGFPHLFGATFLLKMTETSPQIYTRYNITWFQHIHRSNVNKHSLSAS